MQAESDAQLANFMIIVRRLQPGTTSLSIQGLAFIDVTQPLQLPKIANVAGKSLESFSQLEAVMFIEPSTNEVLTKNYIDPNGAVKKLTEADLQALGLYQFASHANHKIFGIATHETGKPFMNVLARPSNLQGLCVTVCDVPQELAEKARSLEGDFVVRQQWLMR